MEKFLILQGPNLNMLGQREPDLYGNETLEALHERLQQEAHALHIEVICYQSNAEVALIEKIHEAIDESVTAIIINPAAFTHTSVALRDALLTVQLPFVEVHLSNIYQRESFRHHSYFSDKALGVISGLGTFGYVTALQYLAKYRLS